MRNIFRRNKQNEPAPKKPDVVVLKKTRPGECGGTDATLDRNAPKEIGSEDLLVFEAESALHVPYGPEAAKEKHLGFVSVFASTAGEGSFLFLMTGEGFRGREERTDAWVFLPENVLPRLGRLVKELNLARNNGYHSTTHGLPENFGG
ncbi:MAG: hypothetical protein ILO68_05010, partial [Clostridia bacterium]|nr:hypothetical protein [Clostridia bacterium]